MINPAIILLTQNNTQRVAEKAAHMSEADPNGLTLTLVSVCVVFGCLLVLFLCYSLSGYLFTRDRSGKSKKGKKAPKGALSGEEAAAVAIAVDQYLGESDEVQAAIATALHLYLNEEVHDIESGIITIKR